jgi:hypothetical protein
LSELLDSATRKVEEHQEGLKNVTHILLFYAVNVNLKGGVINTTKKNKHGRWSRNTC